MAFILKGVVVVVFIAWQGFKGMANARAAWGDYLFKGKFPGEEDKKNNDK